MRVRSPCSHVQGALRRDRAQRQPRFSSGSTSIRALSPSGRAFRTAPGPDHDRPEPGAAGTVRLHGSSSSPATTRWRAASAPSSCSGATKRRQDVLVAVVDLLPHGIPSQPGRAGTCSRSGTRPGRQLRLPRPLPGRRFRHRPRLRLDIWSGRLSSCNPQYKHLWTLGDCIATIGTTSSSSSGGPRASRTGSVLVSGERQVQVHRPTRRRSTAAWAFT